MTPANGFEGVINCYPFKSLLQEYAQKANFPTPVYETVKEGPSHEPSFKCTVIANGIRYESLPGFYNRKAAEQSAAEVALKEIQKSGQLTESIHTLRETGLCKNLLQEYAQKMNYAIPSYSCKMVQPNIFTCTVDIGGIQYIGGAAKSKKEAEIRAARTALLAIDLGSCGDKMDDVSQFTVLPCKNKFKESEGPIATVKLEKANLKKKSRKRKHRGKSDRSKFAKKSRSTTEKKETESNANDSEKQAEALGSSVIKTAKDIQHDLSIDASDEGNHLGTSDATDHDDLSSYQKSQECMQVDVALPIFNNFEKSEYTNLPSNEVEQFIVPVKEIKKTADKEHNNETESNANDSEKQAEALDSSVIKTTEDIQHDLPIDTSDEGNHLGTSDATDHVDLSSCQKSQECMKLDVALPIFNNFEKSEYTNLPRNEVEQFILPVEEIKTTDEHNNGITDISSKESPADQFQKE